MSVAEIELWEAREREYLALAEAPTLENKGRRKELLASITARFPGSKRAHMLSLAELEAEGMNASAFKAYSSMGPTDAAARKRIVGMHRRLGQDEKAIEELVSYLELFQADTDAWSELRDLYVSRGEWKKSVFASEEVILARPSVEKELCRHAELVLSTGDAVLARKYFCRAAELNVKNEEALRGIQKCLHVDSKGCDKLARWVEEKLAN